MCRFLLFHQTARLVARQANGPIGDWDIFGIFWWGYSGRGEAAVFPLSLNPFYKLRKFSP
ncbi:hypothetical protein A3G55_01940 [Candidatus Giovannonibacteria bacterium RIFCSPLOWO2_12_FULL_44_25]|nr:MAG: hypothetical protein A2120_03775 [Candidatus Giovannonibacteria bacterium GWA2_45_15]OGF61076.1 MAG: hypothetical protein A2656_02390 [Candidatus Giovannonibacteria bacterium RIFCSPHIGHO2_01_FULL_44_100]OGF83976.1 MAG: hypothetical protein A3E63_00530 [Candidatus Giovannonibacteria bacterium RIFCSPHIGHO2_12_FULL_45_19]OGF88352.1 MAG: hypothetical protein A3I36_01625 [Candidatus Giovannonibacteria bacterium RIFCSPLOWO2_02_FULL_45_28]OGF94413.1 MAG: hypothetical protein A3G55_01940 [Candi